MNIMSMDPTPQRQGGEYLWEGTCSHLVHGSMLMHGDSDY